jgi:glycosyltransferase involved in cell wall biosynthesis
MKKQKTKICFISLNSFPLFLNHSTGYFGGAEVQISLLAKRLGKDKRFEVSLIAGDYRQKRVVKKEGVTIYRCFSKNDFGFLSIFQFINTLKEVGADIYVDRTMNPKLGLMSIFGKISKKKIVYMVAHDWDCSFKFKDYLRGPFKWLYFWGIKHVNLIISQKEEQRKALRKNFKLNSLVIKSIVRPNRLNKIRKNVLWVGRADRWKQPEKMIELASKIKKERVIMICRQGDNLSYFNILKKLVSSQPNISLLPVVPFNEIDQYFASAKVLINTSEAEGFSNTFLQAGMSKVPVISLNVNPDKYLNKFNCGVYAKNDFNYLVRETRQLLSNSSLRKKIGLNHYSYVKKHHAMENVEEFKQEMIKLCSS